MCKAPNALPAKDCGIRICLKKGNIPKNAGYCFFNSRNFIAFFGEEELVEPSSTDIASLSASL